MLRLLQLVMDSMLTMKLEPKKLKRFRNSKNAVGENEYLSLNCCMLIIEMTMKVSSIESNNIHFCYNVYLVCAWYIKPKNGKINLSECMSFPSK